jgi:uncharacterized protein (TIGR02611 family)
MDETTRADSAPGGPDHHDDAEVAREVTAAEIDQAAALIGSRAQHLVEELIETELETGKREESVEAAKRHIAIRIIRVAAGVIVLILGLVLLAAPGPGLLVIALGLGLLAQDVPFARNLLEKVRARLPQDENGKLPRSTVIMMVVVSVTAVAVSIWFTVRSLSS